MAAPQDTRPVVEGPSAPPTHVVTELQTFNKVLAILSELPFKNVAGLIQELNSTTSVVNQTPEGFSDDDDSASGVAETD